MPRTKNVQVEMPTNLQTFYTLAEASEATGLSRNQIEQARTTGKITPAAQTQKGRFLYSPQIVDELRDAEMRELLEKAEKFGLTFSQNGEKPTE